jgi:hypothetical protein
VFVRTMISMNRRPPQPFIDPHVDLARVQRPLIGHQKWIIPLEPLGSGRHQPTSASDLDRSTSASAG